MLDAPRPCGGVLPVRACLLREASRPPRRCLRLRARPVRARLRGAVCVERALRRDEPRANPHRQQHHRRVAELRHHRGNQGCGNPCMALVRPARLHCRQGGLPSGERFPEGGDDARGDASRGASGGRARSPWRSRASGGGQARGASCVESRTRCGELPSLFLGRSSYSSRCRTL